MASLVRYQAEEAAKEQQLRQRNMALKQEREAMVGGGGSCAG